MSVGYVIPVDPSDLAGRLSYAVEDEDEEELDEEMLDGMGTLSEYFQNEDKRARVMSLLDRIPDKEADLIHLYYLDHKRQADIAAIFQVTQAAISYRLGRGIARLKFLLEMPQISEEDLRIDLAKAFPAKARCSYCHEKKIQSASCPICHGAKQMFIDVEILIGMWETTCQSVVADKLCLTQGRVRHRFFIAVDKLTELAKTDEHYVDISVMFVKISQSFNISHCVVLPQWQGRGGDHVF